MYKGEGPAVGGEGLNFGFLISMIKINCNSNKPELLKLAAASLNGLFNQHKNLSVLFLSSGGSCLDILNVDTTWSLPTDLTISVLDERVSENLESRNFENLKKTKFYSQALSHSSLINPISKGLTPDECAKQFGFELKNWIDDNPHGKIIITQGIGEDGHTAGILPLEDRFEFEKVFFAPETLATYYSSDNLNEKYQNRITVKFQFLEYFVDNSIVFIGGENKKNALLKALNVESELNKTPASVINKMKQVDLFTVIKV